MRLPNSDHVIVLIEKIRDYCLDPTHERGKHKARVFAAALGLGIDDAEWLREKLIEVAGKEEAIELESSEFGERYLIRFELEHNGRRAMVRSLWLVRVGEDYPRLSSCYVE